MPILDVEMVVADDERTDESLAGSIGDAAGRVFESDPGRTWVKLRLLPRSRYAENGGGPPESVLPVFVTVLKARPPAGEVLREEMRRLAEGIAAACGRPVEHVHVVYAPPAAGRIAFGGTLLEGER